MAKPSWNRITIIIPISSRLAVSPFRVLAQYRRKPDEASHCFVADGGHYENTGIGELLKRHCRVIIAVDASCDPNHEFSDFAHLIRWARVRHGVVLRQLPGESSLDEQLQQTVPQEAVKHDQRNKTFDDASTSETPERRAFSKRHIVMARIEYGQAQIPDGLLVLVKASLDGDEPFDLLKYAALEPEFPHHATTDQFYQPDRFESYRQLGAHLSQQLVSCLPNGMKALCDYAGKDDEYLSEFHQATKAAANDVSKTMGINPTDTGADSRGNSPHDRFLAGLTSITEIVKAVMDLIDRADHDHSCLRVLIDELANGVCSDIIADALCNELAERASDETRREFSRYGLHSNRPLSVREQVALLMWQLPDGYSQLDEQQVEEATSALKRSLGKSKQSKTSAESGLSMLSGAGSNSPST